MLGRNAGHGENDVRVGSEGGGRRASGIWGPIHPRPKLTRPSIPKPGWERFECIDRIGVHCDCPIDC